MRQLTSFPSADTARALADYLLTQRIDTRVDRQPEGWAVWVCDEDRLPQARQELDEFTRNPQDPRYTAAARAAGALRRDRLQEEKAYTRRQARFDRRMGAGGSRAWTFTLIAACVAVAILSDLGRHSSAVVQALVISPYQFTEDGLSTFGLQPILHGQVWRLVTPIFVHFGLMHILFNMYMLYQLGGAVEARRGPVRYLLLVLVLAVLSNLAQYLLGHPVWDGSTLHLLLLPNFGGMSGVVYGLFGYVWMKSRYQPDLGLWVHPNTVVWLIGWFFLCMTGWVGPIANGAHAGGLIAGIVIGYVPAWWHSRRS
jgi:GlpG protein